MLALVTVSSAQAVEMATGSGGSGGARRQGWHSERPAVVRARLGVAQSGLGLGLTAMARKGKLDRGHGLLNCQCELSDGSAVANGGSDQRQEQRGQWLTAVTNGGWEVQGAALLWLRKRLECAGLRQRWLWLRLRQRLGCKQGL